MSSANRSSSTTTAHYVPIGLDAVFTVLPQLDLGAAFFLAGPVSRSTSTSSGSGFVSGGDVAHYGDLRVFSIFVNGRL